MFCLRKAQVTAFIIIGLVMLLSLVVAFFLFSAQSKKPVEERKNIEPQFIPETVSQLVKSCIDENAARLIKQIAFQGGELKLTDFRRYDGKSYNYFCMREQGGQDYGCVNRMITRASIESDLNSQLRKDLLGCINITDYESQGYTITGADLTVKSQIAVSDVTIAVEYPFKMQKQDFVYENQPQSELISLPLGMLLDTAIRIANSEINTSTFDKDTFMETHDTVKIQKHKPYPDTLYSLEAYVKERKDQLEFNFGLQGEDTVSRIGLPSKAFSRYGYCVAGDGNCYYNTPQSTCQAKGANYQFSMPSVCTPPTLDVSTPCGDCKSCGLRKNNERWCEYEGLSGDGLDFVGTRHYLKSCINGIIYAEECRDYREEICVQNLTSLQASCRPNRWQQCSGIQNKDDCLDRNNRDCVWNEELLGQPVTYGLARRSHICSPSVSPGFRFWQNQGGSVCGMASEQCDCDGISCPLKWTDAGAQYCYKMGDCGNYYNQIGSFTDRGFFSTDGTPRLSAYPKANSVNETYEPQALKTGQVENPILTGHEFDNKVPVPKLLKGIQLYLQWLSQQDPSDYMWEYIKTGHITFHVRHTLFCQVWGSPFGGASCHVCNISAQYPCSEYSCRSLGTSCEYIVQDGFGTCINTDIANDKEGPKLKFNPAYLTNGFTAQKDMFLDYDNCWTIKPEVQPHTTLNFGFNTSEPAVCKLTPLPTLNYSQIPAIGQENYTTVHNFSIHVLTIEQVKDDLLNTFGLSTILQLGILDTFETQLQNMREKALKVAAKHKMSPATVNEFFDKLDDQYKQSVMPGIAALFANARELVQNILFEIDSRKVPLFVRCIDRSGNQNKDEMCIRYSIAEDHSPPKIISVFPTNNSEVQGKVNLTVTLDEPADCRYSTQGDMPYSEMKNTLQCPNSEFEALFGNLECTGELNIYENPVDFYIRCADNPKVTQAYYINFLKGSVFQVLHEEVLGALNLSSGNKINVTNDFMIKNNETLVELNGLSAAVYTRFGFDAACRYSLKGVQDFDSMEGEMACSNNTCYFIYMNDLPYQQVLIGCIRENHRPRNVNPRGYLVRYFLSS